jgi:sugar phosphate permease
LGNPLRQTKTKERNKTMNNFFILFAAIITLLIAFVQCFNNEDMALFILGCFVCVPAVLVSVVGIILDKNFFEA